MAAMNQGIGPEMHRMGTTNRSGNIFHTVNLTELDQSSFVGCRKNIASDHIDVIHVLPFFFSAKTFDCRFSCNVPWQQRPRLLVKPERR